jgi:hypothetical protein
MHEPSEGRDPEPETGRALDRHLLEYVRDPALWPVLVTVLAVAGTLLTSVLLFAWRARNPFSLAALFALVLATVVAVEADVRRRRLGAGSGILLGLWAASAAAAVLVVRVWGF